MSIYRQKIVESIRASNGIANEALSKVVPTPKTPLNGATPPTVELSVAEKIHARNQDTNNRIMRANEKLKSLDANQNRLPVKTPSMTTQEKSSPNETTQYEYEQVAQQNYFEVVMDALKNKTTDELEQIIQRIEPITGQHRNKGITLKNILGPENVSQYMSTLGEFIDTPIPDAFLHQAHQIIQKKREEQRKLALKDIILRTLEKDGSLTEAKEDIQQERVSDTITKPMNTQPPTEISMTDEPPKPVEIPKLSGAPVRLGSQERLKKILNDAKQSQSITEFINDESNRRLLVEVAQEQGLIRPEDYKPRDILHNLEKILKESTISFSEDTKARLQNYSPEKLRGMIRFREKGTDPDLRSEIEPLTEIHKEVSETEAEQISVVPPANPDQIKSGQDKDVKPVSNDSDAAKDPQTKNGNSTNKAVSPERRIKMVPYGGLEDADDEWRARRTQNNITEEEFNESKKINMSGFNPQPPKTETIPGAVQPPTNQDQESKEQDPRPKLPKDLFEALQQYEHEVENTSIAINQWMSEVLTKAQSGVQNPENIPTNSNIQSALRVLGLQEQTVVLLNRLAGTSVGNTLPTQKTFLDEIERFRQAITISDKKLDVINPNLIDPRNFIPTLDKESEKYSQAGWTTEESELASQMESDLYASRQRELEERNKKLRERLSPQKQAGSANAKSSSAPFSPAETNQNKTENTSTPNQPTPENPAAKAPESSTSSGETPKNTIDAETLKQQISVKEAEIGVLEKTLSEYIVAQTLMETALQRLQTFNDEDKDASLVPISGRIASMKQNIKTTQEEIAKLKKQLQSTPPPIPTPPDPSSGANNSPVNTSGQQPPNPQAPEGTAQDPERPEQVLKRQFTETEKEVEKQATIQDLANLLISSKYKDMLFGVGSRRVTGAEIARRISQNILQLKASDTSSSVDPYFFIPDPFIAGKVTKILESSKEWSGAISAYGTSVLEKTGESVQDEATRNAIKATVEKISKQTNPGLLSRFTGWFRKKGEEATLTETKSATKTQKVLAVGAGLGIAQLATSTQSSHFLAALFAALFSSGTPQATAQQISQPLQQPQQVEQVEQGGGNSQSAEVVRSTDAEAGDTSTGNATQTGARDVNQPPSAAPAGTPVNQPEAPTSDTQTVETPAPETATTETSSIPTAPWRPVPSLAERPVNYTDSLHDYRAYLNKIDRLAEFEKVLTFGTQNGGYTEPTVGGRTINTRAFWWETMLTQPLNRVIKNSNARNLTSAYRDWYDSEAPGQEIRGLPNLVDGNPNFAQSAPLFDRFDKWYDANVIPLQQQIQAKVTREELDYLGSGKLTLGEYLAEIMFLSKKYNLSTIQGLGTVSPEYLSEVQNSLISEPVDIDADVTGTAPIDIPDTLESQITPENAGNAEWAVRMLDYAKTYRVSNQAEFLSFLNGPHYDLIKEYREKKSIGTTYTESELTILKQMFTELQSLIKTKSEAAYLMSRPQFSGLGMTGEREINNINNILQDIDAQLQSFK